MIPLLDEIARNIARISYMKHTSVSSISFEGFFEQYESEFMDQAQAAIDVVDRRLLSDWRVIRNAAYAIASFEKENGSEEPYSVLFECGLKAAWQAVKEGTE